MKGAERSLVTVAVLTTFLFWGTVSAATLKANFNTEKRVGGVTTFDRQRFVSFHYEITTGDMEPARLDEIIGEMNVSIGRYLGGPGASTPSYPGATVEELEEYGSKFIGRQLRKEQSIIYNTCNKIVTDSSDIFQVLATSKDYYGYAQHAVNFFRTHFDDEKGVLKPCYYEPMNEPMNKAKYIDAEDPVAVRFEQSKMIHDVCETIHSEFNNAINVGGYASGYVEYHQRQMVVWEERMKIFLDVAGSCVNFVSTHLYNVEGAMMEGILDIIDAYNYHLYDKVTPHIVSEFGRSSKLWFTPATFADGSSGKFSQPWTPSRDFEAMSAVSAVWMQLLHKVDRVHKAVPFMVGRAMWSYNEHSQNSYPWALVRKVSAPDGSPQWVWSHQVDFFRLLSGVQGDFRTTTVDDNSIVTHALLHKDVGFLLIKNLHPREAKEVHVVLEGELHPNILNITRSRIYLNEAEIQSELDIAQGVRRSGIPIYEADVQESSLDKFVVEPDEFMLLKITFVNPPTKASVVATSHHYTKNFLQPIIANEPISFFFDGLPDSNRKVFVRAGITRMDKRGLAFDLFVNNHRMPVDQAYLHNGPDQPSWLDWGVLEIAVPIIHLVDGENEISFVFPDNGGHVTSCILRVDQTTELQQVFKMEQPVPAAEAPMQRKNYILNPSFEQHGEDWSLSGLSEFQYKVSDAFEGNSALRLRWGDAWATQRVSLEAGADYEVEMLCRVFKNYGQKITLKVHNYDGPNLSMDCFEAVWSKVAVIFKSGASTAVNVTIEALKGSAGLVDLMKLTKISEELVPAPVAPTHENLIQNGDFELVDSKVWRAYDGGIVSHEVGFESTSSAHLTGSMRVNRIRQIVQVKPETDYSLTAVGMVMDAEQRIKVGVRNYDGPVLRASISSLEWSSASLQFYSAKSTSVEIFIAAQRGNVGYVDDVRLLEIPPPDTIHLTADNNSTIPTSGPVPIHLSYSAGEGRIVVVRIFNAETESWVAGTRATIPRGRGSLVMNVLINVQLEDGAPYIIYADIRELFSSTNEAHMIKSLPVVASAV